jgi:hypothetical protein
MPMPAHAQAAPSGRAIVLLPRSDFSLSWSHLGTDDPRFAWDANVIVDLDVLGYGANRLKLWADYEAVLGRERRPYDLNHENYTIEVLAAHRFGAIDVAAGLHHTSRHLDDRASLSVVSWNSAVVEASRQTTLGKSIVDASVALGAVTGRTYVDYTWTGNLRLAVRRPVSENVSLYALGAGGMVGVDPEKAGRTERQCGGLLESGVRIRGRTGALDLYVGYERRVDAYPLDRTRVRWTTVGFRLGTQ